MDTGELDISIDDALAVAGPRLLDRMNTAFEDSMLLVGRVLGGHPDASAARAVAVDGRGLDLVVSDPGGEHAARVEFAAPIGDLLQVLSAAFALVRRARQLSGEPGETSAEREFNRLRPVRTFLTTVSAVTDVHPHLRRITFAGGDLTTFTSLGPDAFLYVLLPPQGRDELTIDRSFTWEQWARMPAAERPLGAYYTVRAWRPEVAELDMLVVLHDPAGPVSAWAARAKPDDPVALWGPRDAFKPPADTDWYLLVADDTGLPAVAAILESLPAGRHALVVGEVDNHSERQTLPERDGVDVTWVYRDGHEPGTAPDRLAGAVSALTLPAGNAYVWGGGESRAMTAVRRYIRHEVGLQRERVALLTYWRHSDGDDDDDEAMGTKSTSSP